MSGYGERLRRAWRLYEADHGHVTVTQLVELLAAAGLKASRAQVSRWSNDLQEPALAEFAALGRVLDVRPAWLAFGDEPIRDAGPDTNEGGSAPRRPPIPMMPVDSFTPMPTPAERAAAKKRRGNG